MAKIHLQKHKYSNNKTIEHTNTHTKKTHSQYVQPQQIVHLLEVWKPNDESVREEESAFMFML